MTQNQKILSILMDGEWHSTGELTELTHIGYPPRNINILRKKLGHTIESRKGKHWEEYRLLDKNLPKSPKSDTLPRTFNSGPLRLNIQLPQPWN